MTAGYSGTPLAKKVRAIVLATELVDIKVCAISDTWSGLEIVWRKEHR